MKAEIKDGCVVLDIGETLGTLSTKQRIEIALNLAVMPDVFEAVVDQIVEGFADPLAHGHWFATRDMVEVQRGRILTGLGKVLAEFVKHEYSETARAKLDAECERQASYAFADALDVANRRLRECGLTPVTEPMRTAWRCSDSILDAEVARIVGDVMAKVAAEAAEKETAK